MEKRLVVSMALSGKSRTYSEITFPLIQKYAQKCNADFHAIYNSSGNHEYIGYEKWEYLKFLNQYDRILHIDSDMIVRSNTPNLFEVVLPGYFGAVDEGRYQSETLENPFVDRFQDVGLLGPKIRKYHDFYFNVGMYIFSKTHEKAFETPIKDNPCFFKEQSHLNAKLQEMGMNYILPWNYNYMSLMENEGLNKDDAYIIHYAGNWRGYSDEAIVQIMKGDIK